MTYAAGTWAGPEHRENAGSRSRLDHCSAGTSAPHRQNIDQRPDHQQARSRWEGAADEHQEDSSGLWESVQGRRLDHRPDRLEQ